MRRLVVLAVMFGAVYHATYAVTEYPTTVAVVVTVGVSFFWLLALDLRRRPWSSDAQRSQDVAYTAAIIAAAHSPGHGGADCPSGYDGFSGCGDAGL
jgi:hypothetical protein